MRKKELKLVKVKITGININNYIKRVIKKNISIIRLIPINYKEVNLIIRYSDYLKIKDMPSIYKITLIDSYGLLKLKSIIKKNIIVIISLIISLAFLYTLSNVIFNVEVVHSKSSVRKLVLDNLEVYGVKKYTWKKNYQQLEEIKNKILDNNKDSLEWIEIITSGVKYIVKVQERLIDKTEDGYQYQSIISSKNATIVDIKALKGEKVSSIGAYVRKGDKVISGIINNTNGTTTLVKATGKVVGEVWYKVNIDYPYVYKEERLTGRNNKVLSINFINKKYSLFNYSKYKEFSTKSKILLKHNFLPFYVSIDRQYELKIIDDILTEEEAISKAIEVAKNKLQAGNNRIISIEDVKIVAKDTDESKITLNLFFKVHEDITDYIEETSQENIDNSEE